MQLDFTNLFNSDNEVITIDYNINFDDLEDFSDDLKDTMKHFAGK